MRTDGRISPILLDVVVPPGGEDRLECCQLQSTVTEGPRLVVRARPLL